MDVAVYYAIRTWLAIREFCCCPRKKTVCYDSNSPPTSSWEFFGDFNIQTLQYSNGRTKHIVHDDPNDMFEKAGVREITPPVPPPPWFFIGCYDSAKSLQDKTGDMDDYIYPGNVISLALLHHLFPGTQRWVYIHPKTFEETEFPSGGIVIEQEHEFGR